MLDVTKFVGELHDYIGRAVVPIMDRIKALESRQPERGADGKDGAPGKDGTSVTLDDIAPLIPAQIRAALDAIPPPKDGRDGKDGADGKDADPINVKELMSEIASSPEVKLVIDALVAEAVSKELPAAVHGIADDLVELLNANQG